MPKPTPAAARRASAARRPPLRAARRRARLAAWLLLAAALGCGSDPSRPSERPTREIVALVAGSAVPSTGYVGETVFPRPVVVGLDAANLPVAGAAIAFTVTEGGGTVERPIVTTDANGVATPERWILGPTPGPNAMVATAAGGASHLLRVTGIEREVPLWAWRPLAAQPDDRYLGGLRVDPIDPRTLYAASITLGLSISRDDGASWSLALDVQGLDHETVQVDPRDQRLLWALAAPDLLLSTDRGRTWTVRGRLPVGGGRSLHISPRDGAMYAGVQWESGTPGIFRSTDGGRTWEHRPLGAPAGMRILPWQIAEDGDGTLYVGCEIADHPQPYRPPFYRSRDRGTTWEDVTGVLPWHVLRIGIDDARRRVLALTEGAGLYESTDQGTTWTLLANPFGAELLVDARDPAVMYGGEFTIYGRPGGAYRSTDGGASWTLVGLPNVHVTALALSPDGARLYASVAGEGIFVADVPPE
jgi:hypothetical protein